MVILANTKAVQKVGTFLGYLLGVQSLLPILLDGSLRSLLIGRRFQLIQLLQEKWQTPYSLCTYFSIRCFSSAVFTFTRKQKLIKNPHSFIAPLDPLVRAKKALKNIAGSQK